MKFGERTEFTDEEKISCFDYLARIAETNRTSVDFILASLDYNGAIRFPKPSGSKLKEKRFNEHRFDLPIKATLPVVSKRKELSSQAVDIMIAEGISASRAAHRVGIAPSDVYNSPSYAKVQEYREKNPKLPKGKTRTNPREKYIPYILQQLPQLENEAGVMAFLDDTQARIDAGESGEKIMESNNLPLHYLNCLNNVPGWVATFTTHPHFYKNI